MKFSQQFIKSSLSPVGQARYVWSVALHIVIGCTVGSVIRGGNQPFVVGGAYVVLLVLNAQLGLDTAGRLKTLGASPFLALAVLVAGMPWYDGGPWGAIGRRFWHSMPMDGMQFGVCTVFLTALALLSAKRGETGTGTGAAKSWPPSRTNGGTSTGRS
jgi:hypothetical protein